MTKQDTDVETFDGVVISQDPPGQHAAGSEHRDHVVRRRVRASGGDDHLDRHDDDRRTVTARVRVAVLAGGRSSEHEISLASARSVVEALDPSRYETTLIEIGRDGAWALPAAPGTAAISGTHETLPIPTAASAVAARLGRRRPTHPARAVRRGRDGAGSARARRCAVRRLRRDCFGALHGQGSVQGGAAGSWDSGRSQRDAPIRRPGRPTRSATRCS